ncbi:unnamed protein product [Toxocara canis]|uniref:RING-type domain-containing protein n=1 Tax=Toxocara canis TaxID=6265 RepID=A0A183UP55_TOXCA|nr:unnamed protein product [Toxocara canis]
MATYPTGATVDLLSLIPKCGTCLEDFDTFLHAPHILPCCHTFCLMCISKEKQRKKRRCMICKEKYSKFLVNTAYLVLIARVQAQRRLEERVSVRCEECDKRVPVMSMRRCATCELEIRKMIAHPHQVFVRRALCESGVLSTTSTGVTSTASSSSESNPNSHQSSLKNHSNGSLFGSSLDSPISCIENAEYFRCGRIGSGLCSPTSNSVSAGSPNFDNSTGEQTFILSNAQQTLNNTLDTGNKRNTPHSYIPNMPRRNRFRGGPNITFVTNENDNDSEAERLVNELLPITLRSMRINRRNTEKKTRDTNEMASKNKQVRSSSLRLAQSLARERRFAVRSEYTLNRETETEQGAHEYENVRDADQVSLTRNIDR